jgi:hypothetical protein
MTLNLAFFVILEVLAVVSNKSCYILEGEIMFSDTSLATFRRNVALLSSGMESRPTRKEQACRVLAACKFDCWAYFSAVKIEAVLSSET